jgi:acetate kinase
VKQTFPNEGPATVLVINSGSSSLKFALIAPVTGEVVVQGLGDRLHSPEAVLILKKKDHTETIPIPGADHAKAMDALLGNLGDHEITAVGHRVVNGGERFTRSILLDDASEAAIAACSDLAPVHAIPNAVGIHLARKRFPHLPQVAVFDTAFHRSMPARAYMYGIPYDLYEQHKIRKYGFHGTSHAYVSQEASRLLGKSPQDVQLITAHLGNGSSVCAVRYGKSADTSMGFTPLEGLVMGTRCGDLDPNVLLFLQEKTGMSLKEITEILNKKSGLLGISGISHDMRVLLGESQNGNERARLAVEIFSYRLARHILASAAALSRIDALVFTGGIGENSPAVRELTLTHLGILGAKLDPHLNSSHGRETFGRISATDSGIMVLVVPTNEELVIAREALQVAFPS